ncbi:MAG: helix-turn-helix transcriptional regulator [Clostridia bacterium]|nr:helix-turn-helix transcriptional regulator [Clostridia bacterium]
MKQHAVASVETYHVRKGHPFLPDSTNYTFDEMAVDGLACFCLRYLNMGKFPVGNHYHPGRFEFQYVKSGVVTFAVGEETYEVSGGHVFVTFPDEVHSIPGGSSSGHTILYFQLEDKDTFLQMDAMNTGLLSEQLHQLQKRVIPVNQFMDYCLTNAFNLAFFPNEFQRQCVANQVCSFLHQLIEMEKTAVSSRNTNEIDRVLQYMKNHVYEKIDLSFFASYCGYTYAYFNTKFKKVVGVTPADYFLGLRVDEAKKMLLEGRSITETAMALDFSSSNYFATVFRRVTGKSPTQWIKDNQKKGVSQT